MKYPIVILTLVFALSSCEGLLFEDDLATTDPVANFEYLWNDCHQKYAYFELKNIDWDSIYQVYRPKVFHDMTQDSLFNVMGSMLSELKDGHVNLISSLNVSFFPIRNQSSDNFDWRIITDSYLPEDYRISGPFIHDFIAGGEIGYIRFSSFTGSVNSNNLNHIFERYQDTDGIILDIRENGGGALADAFEILSRFVDERTLLYYSRIKTGPGIDEFSQLEEAYVEPKGTTYLKPVVVLTDRSTYSAGSFLSLGTKALSNVILMGDTTGGGLGAPNGGQLPNGWRYRFSVTQTLSLDLDEQFENGVPPDISVSLDRTTLDRDEILDRAILHLTQ